MSHLLWCSHGGRGVLAMVLLPRCSAVTLQARSKHFLGAQVDGNQSPHFQHGLGFDASDWLFWFERQPVTHGGI